MVSFFPFLSLCIQLSTIRIDSAKSSIGHSKSLLTCDRTDSNIASPFIGSRANVLWYPGYHVIRMCTLKFTFLGSYSSRIRRNSFPKSAHASFSRLQTLHSWQVSQRPCGQAVPSPQKLQRLPGFCFMFMVSILPLLPG